MTTSGPDAEPESGVAVIDKPAGWTSHQVVAKIRRIVNTRKVGHAGTLDPMATGVLVIGIGRATRLLGYLALTNKTYEATIRLGIATVTDDAEGAVTSTGGARELTDDQIDVALAGLRGEQLQVPSAVSAIKINGVRSYAKVRSGQHVDLEPRPVIIHTFAILDRRDLDADGIPVVDLDVLVECSSGTYVRALARDLGAALGTGGHLTALCRTRVGPFTLQQAQSLTDAERQLGISSLERVVDSAFTTMTIDDVQARYVQNGRRLIGVELPNGTTALLNQAGQFLALYRQEGPDAIAEAVFV
jgi:tRNA pseudouridine55 synthase